MVLVGKDDWIEKAIENRSCVAVTDGSHMRELYPNVFLQPLFLNVYMALVD